MDDRLTQNQLFGNSEQLYKANNMQILRVDTTSDLWG